MAGWATKIEGSVIDAGMPYMPDSEIFTYTRKAVGVVGAIIPWNFPLLMAAWKLAPALATGCTVVLKPAEDTPLSALRLGELIQAAGFPDGVVNIVTGYGHTAGAALSRDPRIDKIAFTADADGQDDRPRGARPHDADVARTRRQVAGDRAARRRSRQGRTGRGERDLLQPGAGVHGRVARVHPCDGVRRRDRARREDRREPEDRPGMDPSTQIGPLVSAKQRQRVCGYIDSGFGEVRARRGRPRDRRPRLLRRTHVLVDTTQAMRVVREEIFGPVLVAMPFDDVDTAVQLANDTPYGLGASIWSNDLSAIHKLVPRIAAGTVWVNCHSLLDNAMPFGGMKQSGFGRELGRAVIDQYTESKSVMMNYA